MYAKIIDIIATDIYIYSIIIIDLVKREIDITKHAGLLFISGGKTNSGDHGFCVLALIMTKVLLTLHCSY